MVWNELKFISLSLSASFPVCSAWGISCITQQQGVNLITSESGKPLSERVLNDHSLLQNPRAFPFVVFCLLSIWIFAFNWRTLQQFLTKTLLALGFSPSQPYCILHEAYARVHTSLGEEYRLCSAPNTDDPYHLLSEKLIWRWNMTIKFQMGYLHPLTSPAHAHNRLQSCWVTFQVLLPLLQIRMAVSGVWKELSEWIQAVRKLLTRILSYPTLCAGERWAAPCWPVYLHRHEGFACMGRPCRHSSHYFASIIQKEKRFPCFSGTDFKDFIFHVLFS